MSVSAPALTQSHRTQTKPQQTHLLAFLKLFLSFGARSTLQRKLFKESMEWEKRKKAGQEINLLSDKPTKANLPRYEGGKR